MNAIAMFLLQHMLLITGRVMLYQEKNSIPAVMYSFKAGLLGNRVPLHMEKTQKFEGNSMVQRHADHEVFVCSLIHLIHQYGRQGTTEAGQVFKLRTRKRGDGIKRPATDRATMLGEIEVTWTHGRAGKWG